MVYCDETRPLLQGARLTAYELVSDHIPATLIADNMAASLMAKGKIDLAVVGCDRMAANGDFANKIGTYSVAVNAHYHGIPFYVALPCSTIDLSLADGSGIPIEERDRDEVRTLYGTRTVLCHLFWRYDLTAEQLFYMVNISLKYFVALPVAILFISATDPSEFAASLNSIGISYKVGYSVAIALRYIPDIQRDYHSISQAQQARGVELGKKEPFFKRMKNSVNILLPLILTSLNRIDTISNAMELRGFGKNSKRTWYTQRPFARRDFVALGVGVVLLLISLTVTIRFGRFYNPFL